MEAENVSPHADRNLTGRFQPRDNVYVFDENLFDIHEGVVQTVKGHRILIDYAQWPEENGWVPRDRVLPVTRRNTLIFKQQEEMRAAAEADSGKAGESSDTEEDDENEAPPPKKTSLRPQERSWKISEVETISIPGEERIDEQKQDPIEEHDEEEEEGMVSTHGLGKDILRLNEVVSMMKRLISVVKLEKKDR
jgi:hypothetical protein